MQVGAARSPQHHSRLALTSYGAARTTNVISATFTNIYMSPVPLMPWKITVAVVFISLNPSCLTILMLCTHRMISGGWATCGTKWNPRWFPLCSARDSYWRKFFLGSSLQQHVGNVSTVLHSTWDISDLMRHWKTRTFTPCLIQKVSGWTDLLYWCNGPVSYFVIIHTCNRVQIHLTGEQEPLSEFIWECWWAHLL